MQSTFAYLAAAVVASDGSLYVADYNSKQVSKLVNSGSGWLVDTVNLGGSWCSDPPYAVGSPSGLGIDANDVLYTFDTNCAVLKRLGPPPPPPPNPPPPPPVLLQPFFTAASCPGAAHRIVAAAGKHVVDSVAGGGWSADVVKAGPAAPTGWLTGVPEVLAANEVPATVDPYSIADYAWVLRGGAGVRIHTGASPAVGSAAGGFSVAVWFRIDDPTLLAVLVALELVMAAPSVPGDNVTLTIGSVYYDPYTPMVSVRALWCCGPGSSTTTTEADYGAHGTARAPCPQRERRMTWLACRAAQPSPATTPSFCNRPTTAGRTRLARGSTLCTRSTATATPPAFGTTAFRRWTRRQVRALLGMRPSHGGWVAHAAIARA